MSNTNSECNYYHYGFYSFLSFLHLVLLLLQQLELIYYRHKYVSTSTYTLQFLSTSITLVLLQYYNLLANIYIGTATTTSSSITITTYLVSSTASTSSKIDTHSHINSIC